MAKKDEHINEPIPVIAQKTACKPCRQYIYIGPSMMNGRLKQNTVFHSTLDEIKQHFAEELERYPQILNLIVPLSQLAKKRQELVHSGNILYQYNLQLQSLFTKQ